MKIKFYYKKCYVPDISVGKVTGLGSTVGVRYVCVYNVVFLIRGTTQM